MGILHYYLKPITSSSSVERKLQKLRELEVEKLDFEYCFNVQVEEEFFVEDVQKLKWILSEYAVQRDDNIKESTFLQSTSSNQFVIEIGARFDNMCYR